MNNIEITELDNISLSTLSAGEIELYDKKSNESHIIPTLNSNGPSVEKIGIETSTDVTIGNQTYFQGTVIIKNLLTSDATNAPVIQHKNKKGDHIELDGWKKIPRNNNKKKRLLIIFAIVSLLLCGVIVLIVILMRNSPDSPMTATTITTSTSFVTSTSTEITTEESTFEPTTFRPITIEARADWSQHPAWALEVTKMKHPVKELFLTETGYRYEHWLCLSFSVCLNHVKKIEQAFEKDYPFDDLPYNFMIPNIETIFEGRGWVYDGGIQNTTGGDRILYIAMMGTFQQINPTDLQFDLLWSLVNDGIQAGYVDPDYKIYVECQKIKIKSPGEKFVKEIQSWPRWSNFSEKWDLLNC